MDDKQIYDVIRFFERARDEFAKRGMIDDSKRCDDAIGLAQRAARLGEGNSNEPTTLTLESIRPRRAQIPRFDEDIRQSENYIRDSAREWGVSEDDAENLLGFDRD